MLFILLISLYLNLFKGVNYFAIILQYRFLSPKDLKKDSHHCESFFLVDFSKHIKTSC